MKRRDFLGWTAALCAGSMTEWARADTPAPPPVKTVPVKTGGVQMIPVEGGKYRVWTKRVGRGAIKVLLLHGGPGVTHEYFECFEDFLPQQGIEFYYYDQLGSHYSDQPEDAGLWTLPRFTDEVEQVRAGLGLEKFYLYGHSWGGMLCMEYALKYAQHLKGLVIASMTASIESYMAYANQLRAQIPPEALHVMEGYEAKGQYEAPEYQELVMKHLYALHVCRLDPWPEPAERCMRHMNQKVYNTIQGPNEFVITGNMKNWDRWADLPKIETPILLTVGRYDEMREADIRRMGTLIPKSRVLVCPNGSHFTMWDDQQTYMRGLIAFLKDVQSGRFA